MLNDALGHADRIVRLCQVVKQDREFVAITSGHHVLRSHGLDHATSRNHQQLVPHLMSKSIVDLLEAIQIDEQQCKAVSRANGPFNGSLQAPLK